MDKQPGSSSSGIAGSGSTVDLGEHSKRWQVWLAVAAVLVAAGVTGSVLAAGSIAHSDADKSRQAFERSSADIASTLQLAIHDEESLVVNASAYIVEHPDGTVAEFRRWLTSVRAFERYPEVRSGGQMVIVSAAKLPAFIAGARADPAGPLGPNGSFEILPPGNRPFYCLSKVGGQSPHLALRPAGFDYCANPATHKAVFGSRESGKGSYEPVPLPNGITLLGSQEPIYRGGVTPATVEARRAAYLGTFGMTLDPKLVLDQALQGHPKTAVTMRYNLNSSDVSFSSGTAPVGAQSFVIDLKNGWTVKTSAASVSGSVFGNGGAVGVLLVGVISSLLLGLLVWVLASSRARALRLVAERTAELHGAQAKVVDTARQAGMAEIATNVLHNVGNVLNSVNVSANLIQQTVRGSKSVGLTKSVALMEDHADDLVAFMTTTVRGKALPGYLAKLAKAMAAERDSIDEELQRLTDGVTHIKEIVNAQQSLAGVTSVLERVRINDLVEDALRMAGTTDLPDVTVVRDFPPAEALPLDRRRIVLILVNLIHNATQAMEHNAGRRAELTLEVEVTTRAVNVSVTDNGRGISAEDMKKIFVHGFTTRAEGNGFGLHSSALAAKEIGGSLTVHSAGVGAGAKFTLEVPLVDQLVPV
jgi:signal transduction histidine kinase